MQMVRSAELRIWEIFRIQRGCWTTQNRSGERERRPLLTIKFCSLKLCAEGNKFRMTGDATLLRTWGVEVVFLFVLSVVICAVFADGINCRMVLRTHM